MDVRLDPAARAAVEGAIATFEAAGHATDDAGWDPGPYAEMFGTLWRASAARIPVPESALDAVEPITAMLIREGRALSAERLLAGYTAARAFERRTIASFARFDAVLTPALALPPQPVGWMSADGDPVESFERQCLYAPYSSFVNVAGLPAITVPVGRFAGVPVGRSAGGPVGRSAGGPVATGGHPVSVQLIGRPGGEATILALAAQLEAARGPLAHPPGW